MTKEDKDLLLKYICMALPYGVCAHLPNHHLVSHKYVIHDINIQNGWTTGLLDCAGRTQIYSAKVEDIKPYLRPMSSMTGEEFYEYNYIRWSKIKDKINYERVNAGKFLNVGIIPIADYLDWLLKNHFDFMGLIPKGLAIEVTKENNPYEI